MTTRLSQPTADALAVDGVQLLPGCYISESRKRLPCEGCGTIFESNREFFVLYKRELRNSPKSGRYCLDCARDILPDRCSVPVPATHEIEIRTFADLVYAMTGEDVNGMDATDYRQAVAVVNRDTTPAEREHFFATGDLPAHAVTARS